MKEAKLYSILLRGAMQLTMSFVKFPGAGEHSSIFIRIGVAQHDFLPAPPGLEQRVIFGIAPQAAHDCSRGAKRLDGFEQRDGHQAGIVYRSCNLHSRSLGETDYSLHILLRFSSADDVVTDRMRGISALQFCDRAESVQHVPSFWRSRLFIERRIERRPKFLQSMGVYACMLADVKRVQMKTEGANFPQQGIDVGS